ncbi:MAG: hypothetical protein WCP89_02830 [archaeon]
MKLADKITKYKLDYLFVVLLWLVVFWNKWANYALVDYVQSTFFDSIKQAYLNNFTYMFNLFDLGRLFFSIFGLLPYLFSFSILLGMIVSFFYIKKLFKDRGLLYSLLFALIFFFNPFVYSRIMVGQIGVLLAYLFMPVSIYYIFGMIEKSDMKNVVKAVVAVTVSSLFSMQFFAFSLLFLLLGIIFIKRGKKKEWKKYILFVVLILLLNAFWVQFFFTGNTVFSSIDSRHENFFSPKMSADIPAIAKVMGMWGFWRESSYLKSYSIFSLPVFYVMLSVLVILMLMGVFFDSGKKKRFFFSLFWIGLILGVGVSHPYTKPLFDFLFNNMPLFNGFRDSHKFVSLIVLAYAYFVPVAILEVKERVKRTLTVVLLVAFVLLFTLPLINVGNQIRPVEYPKDYYDLNSYLDGQNVDGYIVYLPWQTYLTYNWTISTSSDGRIAVPINQIVHKNVIGGIDKYGGSDVLRDGITSCLENKSVSCLENAGVQIVLLDKCAFYPESYSFLSNKAYSNSCFDVYKIDNKKSAEFSVPERFWIGLLASIISLIILAYFLLKK